MQNPLFNDRVSASDPLRAEQARELEGYIQRLKTDRSRAIRDVKKLRARFAQSIGWPPPGAPDAEPARFTKIGEDDLGVSGRS